MTMTTTSQPDMAAIEQVLMAGDLAKLTPAQRVHYYNEVCRSIGVNPLTRPFEYIILNNKLTLYARKDCTDQLRSNRKVTIKIISKEKIDDVYVVTAGATEPGGRTDESTGAVSLANKRGDDLANAIMKAETKAKRRVTLSLCGLGFPDESEIEGEGRTVRVSADGEIQEDPIAAAALPIAELPDFAAMIEAADTKDALSGIAREIQSAKNRGAVSAELHKSLTEKYKARSQALAA